MTTMIRHLLKERVSVYRDTYTTDDVGGRIQSIDNTGTEVRCRIDLPLPQERMAAEQRGEKLSYVVYVQADEDVKRGDRLDAGVGRRLRVLGALRDPRGMFLRLECEQIQSA